MNRSILKINISYFSIFQRGRGRRAALSEISDEEAARYITQLLHEYEQALQQ